MTETLEDKMTEEIFDNNIAGYETLPSPKELMEEIPLSGRNKRFIAKSRREIESIFDKSDKRKIIIVGPCSIHDPDTCVKYAQEIKKLSDEVSDEFLLVLRTYFEKPRTIIGWTGLIYDPNLDESYKIADGLKMARRYLKNITELELPSATEFVGAIVPQYISDMISWAAIGARTTESQVHRQLASGLSMPVGFKNSTSGDIGVAVDAAKSARYAHKFIGIDVNGSASAVQTCGNKYSHVVLRGGNGVPNCKPELVSQTLQLLDNAGISRNVIIDCSHGNSDKKYEKQEEVAYAVMQQIINGNKDITGIMLESYLYEGKQPFPKNLKERMTLKKGVSITDGCISLETTQRVIRKCYELLKNSKN
ncbi:MAG: 3-deoxy-7-phosphoheptulonate synthase [Candidatus Pacearchaeota archaeon]|jgi:3-deoxy-7-phosphoheptulonate synthase